MSKQEEEIFRNFAKASVYSLASSAKFKTSRSHYQLLLITLCQSWLEYKNCSRQNFAKEKVIDEKSWIAIHISLAMTAMSVATLIKMMLMKCRESVLYFKWYRRMERLLCLAGAVKIWWQGRDNILKFNPSPVILMMSLWKLFTFCLR